MRNCPFDAIIYLTEAEALAAVASKDGLPPRTAPGQP